jgi:hypothetical protein
MVLLVLTRKNRSKWKSKPKTAGPETLLMKKVQHSLSKTHGATASFIIRLSTDRFIIKQTLITILLFL